MSMDKSLHLIRYYSSSRRPLRFPRPGEKRDAKLGAGAILLLVSRLYSKSIFITVFKVSLGFSGHVHRIGNLAN